MRRRVEFLKEAIAAHLAFEQTRNVLRQLANENKAESLEWHEAFLRQQQDLAVWSALQLKYGSFDPDD